MNATSYEAELQTLSEQLQALDEKRATHRRLKAKHIELLCRLLQHTETRSMWAAKATRIVDDNDCNGSYPPAEQWVDHHGPALIRICKPRYSEDASEGGFYHDCTVGTDDCGLYVDREGVLYGADFSGTCHFGQFAAHPGTCSRDIAIEWVEIEEDVMEDAWYDLVIAALKGLLPAPQSDLP